MTARRRRAGRSSTRSWPRLSGGARRVAPSTDERRQPSLERRDESEPGSARLQRAASSMPAAAGPDARRSPRRRRAPRRDPRRHRRARSTNRPPHRMARAARGRRPPRRRPGRGTRRRDEHLEPRRVLEQRRRSRRAPSAIRSGLSRTSRQHDARERSRRAGCGQARTRRRPHGRPQLLGFARPERGRRTRRRRRSDLVEPRLRPRPPAASCPCRRRPSTVTSRDPPGRRRSTRSSRSARASHERRRLPAGCAANGARGGRPTGRHRARSASRSATSSGAGLDARAPHQRAAAPPRTSPGPPLAGSAIASARIHASHSDSRMRFGGHEPGTSRERRARAAEPERAARSPRLAGLPSQLVEAARDATHCVERSSSVGERLADGLGKRPARGGRGRRAGRRSSRARARLGQRLSNASESRSRRPAVSR